MGDYVAALSGRVDHHNRKPSEEEDAGHRSRWIRMIGTSQVRCVVWLPNIPEGCCCTAATYGDENTRIIEFLVLQPRSSISALIYGLVCLNTFVLHFQRGIYAEGISTNFSSVSRSGRHLNAVRPRASCIRLGRCPRCDLETAGRSSSWSGQAAAVAICCSLFTRQHAKRHDRF